MLVVGFTCMGCQYSSKPWKKGVTVPQHLYSYSAVTLRDTIKAQGYEGAHPGNYKMSAFSIPRHSWRDRGTSGTGSLREQVQSTGQRSPFP